MLGGDELTDFWEGADCIDIHASASDDSDEEFLDGQEAGFVMPQWLPGISIESFDRPEAESRMR